MIPESDPDNHMTGIDSRSYCKFEKPLSERIINENIYTYATNVLCCMNVRIYMSSSNVLATTLTQENLYKEELRCRVIEDKKGTQSARVDDGLQICRVEHCKLQVVPCSRVCQVPLLR